MKTSIIIPNLDSLLIDRVIKSIDQQTYPADEIIVIGRDRPGLLPVGHPRLRVLSREQPIRPAVARNLGAEMAQGDLLCFLDSDCIAHPRWLATHLSAHTRSRVAVGGGIIIPDRSYWARCDNIATLAPFLADQPQRSLDHLASLNFSIRRDMFRAVGGFDPSFRYAAGEDTDLSFRLRRAGIELRFVPEAVVAHHTNRMTIGAVWRHLQTHGIGYYCAHARNRSMLGRSIRVEWAARYPALAAATAVGFALLDVVWTYLASPALRRELDTLPGVLFARMGWYAGLRLRAERRPNSYAFICSGL